MNSVPKSITDPYMNELANSGPPKSLKEFKTSLAYEGLN